MVLELPTDDDPEDVANFRKRVRIAADMVWNGHVSLDECEAHEVNGRTDEAFREAVREELASDRFTRPEADGGQEQAAEEGTDGSSPDGFSTSDKIDWRALFEEFDMHTPGPDGTLAVSRTTLELAIQVSHQQITGSPASHIESAVEDGDLISEHVASANDHTDHTPGFRLGSELA